MRSRVKRDRAEDHSATLNARLLATNKFAAVPIQHVPDRVKLPQLFTATKEVAVLQAELAKQQTHPLFKLCSQGTKIVCCTQVDYNAVSLYLVAKGHYHYTHDLPGANR